MATDPPVVALDDPNPPPQLAPNADGAAGAAGMNAAAVPAAPGAPPAAGAAGAAAAAAGAQAIAAGIRGAVHTQTIAAPLHFAGNDPPLLGEMSPMDYLRELEIRMAGQGLRAEEDKLAFALATLKGPAHDWYKCLAVRADYRRTYAYFKTKFAHKYRIPGHARHEFNVTNVTKQKAEEDPYQYLARVKAYFDNAAPPQDFRRWTTASEAQLATLYGNQFTAAAAGADDVDLIRRVRVIVDAFGDLWLTQMHNFHIRHAWVNGLLQPYHDIAKAQDKDKEFGALVDKVQDEGAAKIQRSSFKDHASALRAFQGRSNNNNNGNQRRFTQPRVNEVQAQTQDGNKNAPNTANTDNEQIEAVNGDKKCNYCKRRGHVIAECRKKAKRDAEGKGRNGNSNPNQSSGPNAKPRDPTMDQLFKAWANSIGLDTSNPTPLPAANEVHVQDFL